MRITPTRLMKPTALLTLLGLVMASVAATKDDSLQRIASYKEWKTVTPLNREFTLDGSIGG